MAATPSTRSTGHAVRVAEVRGGGKTRFGGSELTSDAKFAEALNAALQESMFTSVGAPGDLKLYATIQSQDQRVSRGLQYTATLVASYKFVDATGHVVWSQTYESEFSSVAFAGGIRTVRAREGAVRENFAAMSAEIRDHWP